MKAEEKIAKILCVPPQLISGLAAKMEKISGKKNIFEKIIRENERIVKEKIKSLGLDAKKNILAEEIFQALKERIKKEDEALFKIFKEPEFSIPEGCRTLINAAKELVGDIEGFFLKEEKAKELLFLNPPANILEFSGAGSVKELMAREELFDVFAALRFVEDSSWLNGVFFQPYQGLKKSDFEKRKIQVCVLPKHWLEIGKKFTGKKLHNISHLKELGLVFVIPYGTRFEGQVLELFSLVLHYLFEINFYSRLFKKYSRENDFAQKVVRSLKGEVISDPLPSGEGMVWRIVQRYLAKDDASDPRLFEPHVNPEVIHWRKAERALTKMGERFGQSGLEFFAEPDWAGDFFKTKDGSETLISFDLIDNVISLARGSTLGSKYLYHQKEALWNKIFCEYMGEEELGELVIENIDGGIIEI